MFPLRTTCEVSSLWVVFRVASALGHTTAALNSRIVKPRPSEVHYVQMLLAPKSLGEHVNMLHLSPEESESAGLYTMSRLECTSISPSLPSIWCVRMSYPLGFPSEQPVVTVTHRSYISLLTPRFMHSPFATEPQLLRRYGSLRCTMATIPASPKGFSIKP